MNFEEWRPDRIDRRMTEGSGRPDDALANDEMTRTSGRRPVQRST
jgi:hypothetical protein